MRRYWVAVASKEHVMNGIVGSFAQACHGKPVLQRMSVGDGIIYYSPAVQFRGQQKCQQFTAIGRVTGQGVYPFDMGGGFVPFRRDVEYNVAATPVSIIPLVPRLNFIDNKRNWGFKFRFGFFEIPAADFQLIESEMLREIQ